MSPSQPAMRASPLDVGGPEQETEVVGNPGPPIPTASNRIACLVQIYPANASLGQRHLLNRPLTLGRDEACEVFVDENSVSRYHARIVERNGDYFVADLRSTNGTFVNNARVCVRELADGDYLRVGNHIYRFLSSGNIEADYHEEIYRRTITDTLTSIHNKRYLFEFLDRELARCARHHRPLSLVIFDIDHFKAINDAHGHLTGDAVLRSLASRLQNEIRRDELFARFGGEEFAVVLPETDAEGASKLAERLRNLVAREPFEHNGRSIDLTISLGLTSTCGDEMFSATDFVARADEKLYQAKNQGRNCVGT